MTFEPLGLRAELLRAIDAQGFTSPTPIQQRSIPVIMEGRDIMASAQTGTGKTAAFALPTLQRLADGRSRNGAGRPAVRALVLAPTRELAAQVHENFRDLGRHLPLKSAVVFGGVNINPQINTLKRGVDILIATPGRLIDLMERRCVQLDQLEVLILDEADRMLDMGFLPAIQRILKAVPARRQTLLFSATFSAEITNLAARFLNDPVRVETAPPNSTVEAIAQKAIPVDQDRKRELLSWMIGSNDWHQVLVFTRTKHGANRLAKQLESDGVSAAAIHGNKSQGARTRALGDFKSGKIRALVATDIAARGLDIEQLPHVVNYDIPEVPEDYVHRIGRTGRAGRDGLAVSLVAGSEHGKFEAVRKLVKVEIPTEIMDGYEPTEPLNHSTKSKRGGGGGGGGQRTGNRTGNQAGNRGGNARAARSGGPRKRGGGSGNGRGQQGRSQRGGRRKAA
ncbi:DEAD/DEAH box helicase [Wenzhouxiangella sp. XN79A]|uniref:DEAD/DEAH box helicase n=1 Tax=Wenzhouxiangella sp. XN79A TaxID=2724193 RepID=UPI00144A7D26|nr:DEAD/DEAH box helicase [Wenzhouxiangella sp. XN79A]NKI35560.1 DEAD/DEAH box helicase [Wenzhouxiangella sp. XN79A]